MTANPGDADTEELLQKVFTEKDSYENQLFRICIEMLKTRLTADWGATANLGWLTAKDLVEWLEQCRKVLE